MLRGIIIAALLGGVTVWMAGRGHSAAAPTPVPVADQVASVALASPADLARLIAGRGWCVIGRADRLGDATLGPRLEALVRRRGDVRLRWVHSTSGETPVAGSPLELYADGARLATGVEAVFRRLRR